MPAFSLALVSLLLSCLLISFGQAGGAFFLAGWCGAWGSLYLLHRFAPPSLKLWHVLLLSLGLHLMMLKAPGSDDLARYRWEGRMQQVEGYNPYLHAPDDPAFASHRTPWWQEINHKDWATCYQPLALRGFAWVESWNLGSWASGALAFKMLMGLFSMGVLGMLAGILKRCNAPPRHLLLYGANPLVLCMGPGEGHLEMAALCFLMAALYVHGLIGAHSLNRVHYLNNGLAKPGYRWPEYRHLTLHALAFLLLGCAIAVKITFLPALLFLVRPEDNPAPRSFKWRFYIVCLLLTALPLLLFWLPYAEKGLHPLGTTLRFGLDGLCHACLPGLLEAAVGTRLAVWLSAAALLLGCLSIRLLVSDPMRAVYLAFLLLLLVLPKVHPWYFLMLTPFFALYRSPALWSFLALSVLFCWWQGDYVLRLPWLEQAPGYRAAVLYGVSGTVGLWILWRGRTRAPRHFSLSLSLPELRHEACTAGLLACPAGLRPRARSGRARDVVLSGGPAPRFALRLHPRSSRARSGRARDVVLSGGPAPRFALRLHPRSPRARSGRARDSLPPAVAVVVPVLNEASRLGALLESLCASRSVSEILVVDGGSTDGGPDLVRAYPDSRVRLLEAPKGRGFQIAAGVAASTAGLIAVVHADCRVLPSFFDAIRDAAARYPDMAGGCLSQAFDQSSWRYRMVSGLNAFRAKVLGIAFGDQVQFFRREAVPDFPAMPLMEDVELSLRIRSRGGWVVLPCRVQASTRRWESRGFQAQCRLVLRLTGGYLLMRSLGRIDPQATDYLEIYEG